MVQSASARSTSSNIRWTTADVELLPESSNRYEIIDGELLVTRAPHWGHQKASTRAVNALDSWSLETGLGEAVAIPGILFTDADNVIPDLVWITQERLAEGLDEGHLVVAPELVVEVLAQGTKNEQRDREMKLKLYGERGVLEYWMINWRSPQVEVYRRQDASSQLVCTLFPGDEITSPLLPGFSCAVARLFA